MKNYTQKFIGILTLVFTICFSVNAQQDYDVTPPVITSIMASPEVVDVSESSQFVTITATGTDDLSGIQSLNGYFSAPTNGGLSMWLYPDTLANGDVVYVGEIEVPHASSYSTAIEPGVYTFNFANAYDNAGNSSGWYSDSFQTTFEVTYITFVLGCTDATAFNYNADANTDDGSCIAVMNGCIDATAFNYNADANTDDGSCIAVMNGCTDATAFNYNPDANTDDGSCIAVMNGCTDATAFNYNADANTDDGSCEAVEEGCTDETAFNYNADANTDDGSCEAIVEGCTDATAFNYNSDANTDDGSCIDIVTGCLDETAYNYNAEANTDDGTCLSWQEVVNNLQADVDAAFAAGVASVEIPECEEVATLNIPLDLPQGWSMFGYTCMDSVDAVTAFSEITDKIEIVKDEWGLAYITEWGFNGLGSLHFSEGYQIKMLEEVTDFQFCTTIVGTSSQEEPETEPQLQIGDQHAGGIVFYVDETGEHGLVAAIQDLEETYQWGCWEASISGADGESIGTGYQNTLDIVSGCSETPIAASEALAYESEGYSDWYLPSKDELIEMYNTIGNGSPEGDIGGFGNNWYWSSSENYSDTAWNVGFGSGGTVSYGKGYADRVRVIRAF